MLKLKEKFSPRENDCSTKLQVVNYDTQNSSSLKVWTQHQGGRLFALLEHRGVASKCTDLPWESSSRPRCKTFTRPQIQKIFQCLYDSVYVRFTIVSKLRTKHYKRAILSTHYLPMIGEQRGKVKKLINVFMLITRCVQKWLIANLLDLLHVFGLDRCF